MPTTFVAQENGHSPLRSAECGSARHVASGQGRLPGTCAVQNVGALSPSSSTISSNCIRTRRTSHIGAKNQKLRQCYIVVRTVWQKRGPLVGPQLVDPDRAFGARLDGAPVEDEDERADFV